MCIIVAKMKDAKMPTKKTLETCFKHNNDGAGFMYSDGKRVYINKGFMNFDAFYKALKIAIDKVSESAPFVLHFRISTQAGTRADCCHPYPLCDNMSALRKLKTTTSIGIAHNGIIALTSTHDAKIDYNDTMQFIVEYLSLIITQKDDLNKNNNIKLINRLSGSKLAFLTGDGEIVLTGDGWTNDGGIWYSNSSYLEYKYTTTNYYQYYYGDDGLFNEWDEYRDVNGQYLFDEYYCPYTETYDTHYCAKCMNYEYCYGDGDN